MRLFHATHTGAFLGVAPSGRRVVMEVIDIIELRNGKYINHWGILDMHSLMMQLTA
jgi:predicted ester cyclase